MKIRKNSFGKWYLLIVVLLIGSLSMNSCRRMRYKRMIKKRRAGNRKHRKHRGPYQRKLKKKAVTTNSSYYIKAKRNYRRRPWYEH